MTTGLADIFVIQAIRSWIDRDPAAQQGWPGALHDPQCAQALAAVHRSPGNPWTVASLARGDEMSGARLVERIQHPRFGRRFLILGLRCVRFVVERDEGLISLFATGSAYLQQRR